MSARAIPPESAFAGGAYTDPVLVRRREVLRETVAVFEGSPGRAHYAACADANLGRWNSGATSVDGPVEVRVIRGDWGVVAGALTREFGVTFAVLNMANAIFHGGGYLQGLAAQEENMFRRTDCHLAARGAELVPGSDLYTPGMRALLEAENGRVYLEVERPRLCIRGPEDRAADDLGYRFLRDDEVFPFYELRAAAQDLRGSAPFDVDNARFRIRAQLDTLIEAGVRHAVLGAFGCGAFLNPARTIATLYREAIEARRDAFVVIAFAIHDAGYGPDNHTPFASAFA